MTEQHIWICNKCREAISRYIYDSVAAAQFEKDKLHHHQICSSPFKDTEFSIA